MPIESGDRGILPGMLLLVLVLFLQRFTILLEGRSGKLAHIIQSTARPMVLNGVLQLGELKQERLSKSQIMSVLRQQGVDHLGQVKRLYLETHGGFSIVREHAGHAGLSTYASDQVEVLFKDRIESSKKCCRECGRLAEMAQQKCECETGNWTFAIN